MGENETHLQADPRADRVPEDDELGAIRAADAVLLDDALDERALVLDLVVEAREASRVEASVLVEAGRVAQVPDGVQLGLVAQLARERVAQRGEEVAVKVDEAGVARDEEEDKLEREGGRDRREGEDVGRVMERVGEGTVAAAEGGLGRGRGRGGEGGEDGLVGRDDWGRVVCCAREGRRRRRGRRGGRGRRRRVERGDGSGRGPRALLARGAGDRIEFWRVVVVARGTARALVALARRGNGEVGGLRIVRGGGDAVGCARRWRWRRELVEVARHGSEQSHLERVWWCEGEGRGR